MKVTVMSAETKKAKAILCPNGRMTRDALAHSRQTKGRQKEAPRRSALGILVPQ